MSLNRAAIRIFFVAKRKRKRKSTTKPQVKRSKAPFVGDQILALYHLFGSCCCLGLLSLIGSLGLGVTAVTSNKQEAIKYIHDKQALEFLNKLTPDQGIIIFAAAGALFVFALLYIRAIWQGKKWAFWISLLTSAPSAGLTIYANQSGTNLGSLIPVIVAIYCILRLLGSVGPKM